MFEYFAVQRVAASSAAESAAGFNHDLKLSMHSIGMPRLTLTVCKHMPSA